MSSKGGQLASVGVEAATAARRTKRRELRKQKRLERNEQQVATPKSAPPEERPKLDLARHLKLPPWPWQNRRLGYNERSPDDLPRRLYYVQYGSSNSCEDDDRVSFVTGSSQWNPSFRAIKAPCFWTERETPLSPWDISPNEFRDILKTHKNSRDATEEMIWLSAYSRKKTARQCAENRMNEYGGVNTRCRLIKFSTEDSSLAVYKAADLVKEFGVELHSWNVAGLGEPRMMEDEYLILHVIPRSAVLSVKLHLPPEERYALTKPPINLGQQQFWESLKLQNLPERLYRVIHSCGYTTLGVRGSLYFENGGGSHTMDDTHPRDLSDAKFWKSVLLHLNHNTDKALRIEGHGVFISTFSDRETAITWAWKHASLHRHCDLFSLLTIETKRADLTAYSAAAMISDLLIPLKEGFQVSDFEQEYLVLHTIPDEAIIEEQPFA